MEEQVNRFKDISLILNKFCLSVLHRFLDFEVEDDVQVAAYEKTKGE